MKFRLGAVRSRWKRAFSKSPLFSLFSAFAASSSRSFSTSLADGGLDPQNSKTASVLLGSKKQEQGKQQNTAPKTSPRVLPPTPTIQGPTLTNRMPTPPRDGGSGKPPPLAPALTPQVLRRLPLNTGDSEFELGGWGIFFGLKLTLSQCQVGGGASLVTETCEVWVFTPGMAEPIQVYRVKELRFLIEHRCFGNSPRSLLQ